MPILEISQEYLKRESINPQRSVDWINMNTGESVNDWVMSYLKRNIIPHHINEKNELIISFKSHHQLICFVRNGNRTFPYFEFW